MDKPIKLYVVKSTTGGGRLSLRMDPNDPMLIGLREAVTEEFREGDELELRLVHRERYGEPGK